jgi:hypothetical protein
MRLCRRLRGLLPHAHELLEPIGSPLEVVTALGGALDCLAQVVRRALEALGVNCVFPLHSSRVPPTSGPHAVFPLLIPTSYPAARPRANWRKASAARVGTRPLARTT